jgi:hypothetical protein
LTGAGAVGLLPASTTAAHRASPPPTRPTNFCVSSGVIFPAVMPSETASEASPAPLRTIQASCFISVISSTKSSSPLSESVSALDTLLSVPCSAVSSSQ